MDPTSVSNNLITLSTLTANCGDRLGTVINATRHATVSSEAQALFNEVTDLRIVLGDVEGTYWTIVRSNTPTRAARDIDALARYLVRAQSRLLELDQLIRSSVKPGPRNEPVFQRRAWLQKKNIYRAVLRDIRAIKENIVLLLVSRTT